jgi:ferredoxin
VFVLGDDGFAEVREEVDLISHHEGIEEAADACPTAAIEVDG